MLLLQGWRKNMEDAHIALTELSSETLTSAPKFSLFAVFDGHGGQLQPYSYLCAARPTL
jgi:serine/threonine protein phosphatase PrpC